MRRIRFEVQCRTYCTRLFGQRCVTTSQRCLCPTYEVVGSRSSITNRPQKARTLEPGHQRFRCIRVFNWSSPTPCWRIGLRKTFEKLFPEQRFERDNVFDWTIRGFQRLELNVQEGSASNGMDDRQAADTLKSNPTVKPWTSLKRVAEKGDAQ